MKSTITKDIQHIIKQIVIGYHPEKIILFGSCARSAQTVKSDIDLVIIKETDDRFVDRLKKIATVVKTWEAADFLVYTPQEWNEALSKEHYFIMEIAHTGRVLYEKKS